MPVTDIDPTVDYYQCLGVPTGASAEDVKHAYRAIAKTHHPDSTGGDVAKEAKFKLAAIAYGVLGDAGKRAQYDAARKGHARRAPDKSDVRGHDGHAGDAPGRSGGNGSGSGRYPASARAGAGSGELFDLSHLVNEFLGGDLLHDLGGIAKETITREVANAVGHGGPDTADARPKARPRAQRRTRTDGGRRHVAKSVTACDGSMLEVDTDGISVCSERTIRLETAIMGGKTSVATLGGHVDVTIRPGFLAGSRLRLPGRGISGDGKTGDHYVLVRVETPRADSERSRADARAELLRILDAIDAMDDEETR